MDAEPYRLWTTRNKNGLIVLLSLYGLFSSIRVLLSLKQFDVPSLIFEPISIFATGFLVIHCSKRAWSADMQLWATRAISSRVEDRLDELERLKRRDMVTHEEYAAKRQEILKDL